MLSNHNQRSNNNLLSRPHCLQKLQNRNLRIIYFIKIKKQSFLYFYVFFVPKRFGGIADVHCWPFYFSPLINFYLNCFKDCTRTSKTPSSPWYFKNRRLWEVVYINWINNMYNLLADFGYRLIEKGLFKNGPRILIFLTRYRYYNVLRTCNVLLIIEYNDCCFLYCYLSNLVITIMPKNITRLTIYIYIFF